MKALAIRLGVPATIIGLVVVAHLGLQDAHADSYACVGKSTDTLFRDADTLFLGTAASIRDEPHPDPDVRTFFVSYVWKGDVPGQIQLRLDRWMLSEITGKPWIIFSKGGFVDVCGGSLPLWGGGAWQTLEYLKLWTGYPPRPDQPIKPPPDPLPGQDEEAALVIPLSWAVWVAGIAVAVLAALGCFAGVRVWLRRSRT